MKNEYKCTVYVLYNKEEDVYLWDYVTSSEVLANLARDSAGKGWVLRSFLINGHSWAPVTTTVITDGDSKQVVQDTTTE